jgi:hypothetical protein
MIERGYGKVINMRSILCGRVAQPVAYVIKRGDQMTKVAA